MLSDRTYDPTLQNRQNIPNNVGKSSFFASEVYDNSGYYHLLGN